MVVTDGRRPGYSVGMTNFELAQTLVRLGAVTGSAFDGGGSTTLAFDGSLLNRPSDPGGERPASTALQLMYYGVYAPTPSPVISPNGDGVAEQQRELSYKVVRPSTVTATLVGPGGVTAFTESRRARAGDLPGRVPARAARPAVEPSPPAEGPLAARRLGDRRHRPGVDDVAAVHRQLDARLREALAPQPRRSRARQADDQRRRDAEARRPRARDRRDRVRRPGRRDRPAPRRAGRFVATWKGHTRGGRSFAYGGSYVIRFRATNELGVVELTTPAFRVIRAAPIPLQAQAQADRVPGRCRSPRSSPRSRISSRPWSATTASTPSFC